jgi:ATP-dependent Clp protease ATP-binding subunit ClpA
MNLLQRSRRPRAKTIRPAERYLIAGAAEARGLGHAYVGTEHVLAVLVRDPESSAVRVLAKLGISVGAVAEALACWLPARSRSEKIGPEALASLGIDVDAVRERLEQIFGPGVLERSRSSCLGIQPRLKLALAYALDHAAGGALNDTHVLLGMLSVPESVAARARRARRHARGGERGRRYGAVRARDVRAF